MSDRDELDVDEALSATGRAPLADDIDLAAIELILGGWLDVDHGYLLGMTMAGPASPTCCTRPLSPSPVRCPSTGCGTPRRAPHDQRGVAATF
ncbi:hypothetical protein M5I08_22340 [Candidatus Mycobacterium methanotrophicum]|uniref:Uncharacterized protein n=1 Tax=Candidatus Mycobacterium methanotrophicum TaxID=2943498 RepID=A0ABY4QKD4_9MYCO|nr:hypothetical protein [Candidatus Mycobacterium methanotrophicum]UQX10702.1 hypothetical protein M5I08_22340 [Candidatus Mycobacterium methanotrophicum]